MCSAHRARRLTHSRIARIARLGRWTARWHRRWASWSASSVSWSASWRPWAAATTASSRLIDEAVQPAAGAQAPRLSNPGRHRHRSTPRAVHYATACARPATDALPTPPPTARSSALPGTDELLRFRERLEQTAAELTRDYDELLGRLSYAPVLEHHSHHRRTHDLVRARRAVAGHRRRGRPARGRRRARLRATRAGRRPTGHRSAI